MDQESPPLRPPQKGRGAVTNDDSKRFNLPSRQADGDWLDEREALGDAPSKLRTQVTLESPISILNFNKSPDIPFNVTVQAYCGCEHGCIYCIARPTHASDDLSPVLYFETNNIANNDDVLLLRVPPVRT